MGGGRGHLWKLETGNFLWGQISPIQQGKLILRSNKFNGHKMMFNCRKSLKGYVLQYFKESFKFLSLFWNGILEAKWPFTASKCSINVLSCTRAILESIHPWLVVNVIQRKFGNFCCCCKLAKFYKNPITLQWLCAFLNIEPFRIQGLCWSNENIGITSKSFSSFTSRS